MKQVLLISLLVCSTNVLAVPYIGVQYGIANISNDEPVTFVNDNVSLTPDGSSDAFGAYIGYAFTDNFAIEVSYNRY